MWLLKATDRKPNDVEKIVTFTKQRIFETPSCFCTAVQISHFCANRTLPTWLQAGGGHAPTSAERWPRGPVSALGLHLLGVKLVLSKHSGPRSTGQGLHLLGDELVKSFDIWTAILRHRLPRSGFRLADRRNPGFDSPIAAIRVSTRRHRVKGQLLEPNQTRSMVQRIIWSSPQTFDLVHPGSLGNLSADQTPAKLVLKHAVILLTYPSNGP